MGGNPRVGSSPTSGTAAKVNKRIRGLTSSSPTERSSVPSSCDRFAIAPDRAHAHAFGVGRRVLVVDDDDALRTVLREAMTEAGFNAVVARDGFEAMKI